VGRVVFGKNAEQDRWSRLDSLLHDIAADQPSDPSIVPDGPAIDPQDSASNGSGVVAPSSRQDIFQSATEATASSQGGHAARQEEGFIDPGTSDSEVDDSFRHAENFSMFTAGAR
jgi:hypothetical protein